MKLVHSIFFLNLKYETEGVINNKNFYLYN